MPYCATRDGDILAPGPASPAAIRALLQEIYAVPCSEDTLGAEDWIPSSRAWLSHLELRSA
jgi:hypothetical protein